MMEICAYLVYLWKKYKTPLQCLLCGVLPLLIWLTELHVYFLFPTRALRLMEK